MNDQRWLKNLIRFGLPAIVLIFYIAASSHFAYTPDDTYIYLQFAKNILRGDGFAFNAAEPTYGITSPLWLVLVTGGGWVGIDLYIVAKVLDLVFASLALVLVYLFAFEIIRDHGVALCATLAFSVNIWFLRWAATGMETSFAVLLLVLTIRYCLKNEYLLAIVFAALLTLTRPEAWLLALLIFVDVYQNSLDKRRGGKMVLALLIVYAALLAPWLIYAYGTFGTLVPNTVLAKAGLTFHVDDFAWTFADIAKTLAVSDGVTVAVVLAGTIFLVKRRHALVASGSVVEAAEGEKPISNAEWLKFNILPLSWGVGLPLLYVVTGANVVSRYLLLIVPIIVVYAFALLSRVLATWHKGRFRYAFAVGLTAVVIGQNQFLYYNRVQPSIAAFSEGMRECFIPIGKWLKTNTPDNAVVFAPDIGAIGYYSERKICDAAGLVSPELLNFVRKGYLLNRMMEERVYRTVCNASYVVHRSNTPNEFQSAELNPLFTKIVYGLGLSDPSTVYYTVYKVDNSLGE